jgi:hypothetical protein
MRRSSSRETAASAVRTAVQRARVTTFAPVAPAHGRGKPGEKRGRAAPLSAGEPRGDGARPPGRGGDARTRHPGSDPESPARAQGPHPSEQARLEHFPMTRNRNMLREALPCRVFAPARSDQVALGLGPVGTQFRWDSVPLGLGPVGTPSRWLARLRRGRVVLPTCLNVLSPHAGLVYPCDKLPVPAELASLLQRRTSLEGERFRSEVRGAALLSAGKPLAALAYAVRYVRARVMRARYRF